MFLSKRALVLLFLAFWINAAQAETLTYPDLVTRLWSLDRLASLPPPGEKTALASSYDRSSRYDAARDKYFNWDANNDGTGIVRKEGDNDVMADLTGPGCIWRTWAATVGPGHVKIYLDGATEPAVDLPFSGYFDGKNEPFTRPNLVYQTTAKGYDNFTPIPFQKSCKIVAEKGWGKYYHFNYTRFPADTVVPTFHLPLGADDLKALDQADQIFSQAGQNPFPNRPGQHTETLNVTVPKGGSAVVAELTGPEAITELKLQSDWPKVGEAQRMLLAQLTVSITWDDDAQPAVWAPLGDFFAASAGLTPFHTLPMGLNDDGTFYSYWFMPLGKSAKIEMTNDSDHDVTLTWQISTAPLEKPATEYLRFHAKWHRDAFLPQRADRWPDWTLLTTQGEGRYVGTQLHVWNPRTSDWWGEGDEKFFIDGEKFPSTFGTGSEDYFGYAWSSGSRFIRALHSLAVNKVEGHVSVNRWHLPDSLPFQTSFDGYIEKYFPNDHPCLYAAVVYWYLKEGGIDPYVPCPVEERAGWWIYQDKGAMEGETLEVDPALSAVCRPEKMPRNMSTWSGDAQLLWQAKAVGEKIALGFTVENAGRYQVQVRLTKGKNYGMVALGINGQTLGAPVDLFDRAEVVVGPTDLGVVTLGAGKQVLNVTVVGKNAQSSGYHFGLDWIKLTPVP
jgi:hypothetical protein